MTTASTGSRVKRPRPTVRGRVLSGCGVISLAIAAWLGRFDFLFVGLLLCLLPLAGMLALLLDRPWLAITRTFAPDIVTRGDIAQATITVRNEAARPTANFSWREAVQPGLDAPGAQALPWLSEHGPATRNRPDAVTLRYSIGTTHRGVYDVGPLIVSRVDPFGLARAEYAVGGAKPLLVTPRVAALDRGALDVTKAEGIERALLRQSIPSADELIAREYRTGDPLRRVHWRATARHDKLMVRQEEQRSNPDAWLLLETVHAERHSPRAAERDPEFEKAVELAASLGVHLLDEGFVLNVVETGHAQAVGGLAGKRVGTSLGSAASFERPAGDQQLLATLAGIRQSENEGTDYAGILGEGLRRSGRSEPAFLILVDRSPHDLAAVAALRAQSEPAIAFLVGETREAERMLQAQDWTCVPVPVDSSVRDVWLDAMRRNQAVSRRG